MNQSRNRGVTLLGLLAFLAFAGILVWALQMGSVTGKLPGSASASKPAMPTQPDSAVRSTAAPADAQAKRPGAPPSTPLTALTISLNSDGELLLTDPSGRRTGFDSITKSPLREIPNATYINESIDDPNDDSADSARIDEKDIDVRPPQPGVYTLTVYSASEGAYDLELRTDGGASQSPPMVFKNLLASAGLRQAFSFTVPATGGPLEISGAFAGSQQTNGLLTFAGPLADQITLPSNSTSFPLVICYGRQSDAPTFSATLNGRPITASFHPVAGRIESVELPLHQGSNLLELAITGAGSAANVTVRDQFVFLVGSE